MLVKPVGSRLLRLIRRDTDSKGFEFTSVGVDAILVDVVNLTKELIEKRVRVLCGFRVAA